MSARITVRQCQVNQARDMFSCGKCTGLVNVAEVKEEDVVSKRGTCAKCKRPDMSIVARGLCGKCYAEEKEKGFPPLDADSSVPEQAASPVTGERSDREAIHPLTKDDSGKLKITSSALLPPPVATTPKRPGIFLDLSNHPDLDAWLKETCEEDDIPLAIIGLLEYRRKDLLRVKEAA